MNFCFFLLLIANLALCNAACTWVFGGPKDGMSCQQCDGVGNPPPIELPDGSTETQAPVGRITKPGGLNRPVTNPDGGVVTNDLGKPVTLPPETGPDGKPITGGAGNPVGGEPTNSGQQGNDPIKSGDGSVSAGEPLNLGLILGIVGGVICCCVLIFIVVFLARRDKDDNNNNNGGTQMDAMSTPIYGGTNGINELRGAPSEDLTIGVYGPSPVGGSADGLDIGTYQSARSGHGRPVEMGGTYSSAQSGGYPNEAGGTYGQLSIQGSESSQYAKPLMEAGGMYQNLEQKDSMAADGKIYQAGDSPAVRAAAPLPGAANAYFPQ